jgi:hypothetical protein
MILLFYFKEAKEKRQVAYEAGCIFTRLKIEILHSALLHSE